MSHQHHHSRHEWPQRVCEAHLARATTSSASIPLTVPGHDPPFSPTTLRLDHLPDSACPSWGIPPSPGRLVSPYYPLRAAQAVLYTPAEEAHSAFLADRPGPNVPRNVNSQSQGRGLSGHGSLGAAVLEDSPDSNALHINFNTTAQVSQALGSGVGRWTASGSPPLKSLGRGPARQIISHRPWEDAVNSSPSGSSESESAGASACDDSFISPCWWPRSPTPPPFLRQPKRFRPILVYPPDDTQQHVQQQRSGHYRRCDSGHHSRLDRNRQASDHYQTSCCSPLHSGVCCYSPTCRRHQIGDNCKTCFSRQYLEQTRNCCCTQLPTCCITSCDLFSPGDRLSGANSFLYDSKSPRRYYQSIDKSQLRHLSSWTESPVCEASTPVFKRRSNRIYQMETPRTSTCDQSMKNSQVRPQLSVEDVSCQRSGPVFFLPEISSTSYHQESRASPTREVLSVPTFSFISPVPPLPASSISSSNPVVDGSTSRRHVVSGRLNLIQQNSVPESHRRDNRRQGTGLQSSQVPCHSSSQESFLFATQNLSSSQSCQPIGWNGPLAKVSNQIFSPTVSKHQPCASPIDSQSTMYAVSPIKDLSISLSTAQVDNSNREQTSLSSQTSMTIHNQTSMSLLDSGSGVSSTKVSQAAQSNIPAVSSNGLANVLIDKPVILNSHPSHSSAHQISISNCQLGESLQLPREAPGKSIEQVNLFCMAPKRTGLGSPTQVDPGNSKQASPGSAKQAGLGSAKPAGLRSPKCSGLRSPKCSGPGRKSVRGRRFSCADFDISVLDFEDLLTPRINPAQLSTQSMIDLSQVSVDSPHTNSGQGTSLPSQYQRPLPGVNKCPRLLAAASVPNLHTPVTSSATRHFLASPANKAFKPPEIMDMFVAANSLASLSALTEVSSVGNVQEATIGKAATESSCLSDSVLLPAVSSPLSASSSLPLTLSSIDAKTAPITSSPAAVSTGQFTDQGSAFSEAPVMSHAAGEDWLDYTYNYGSFLQLLHTPDLPSDGATYRPRSTRIASRPPSRGFPASLLLGHSAKDLLANPQTASPQLKIASLDVPGRRCFDQLKVPSLDVSGTRYFDQPLAVAHQNQLITAAQTTKEGDETESRRHKCPLCGLACTNHGQLKGHLRVHTGERPYRCQCGRGFARKEELTRHKRIHLGLRPFSCTVCCKSFGRRDHLTKHEKTHLGRSEKKVHTCTVLSCGQSYTRSDALARHQWSSHSIRPRSVRRHDHLLGQDLASHCQLRTPSVPLQPAGAPSQPIA